MHSLMLGLIKLERNQDSEIEKPMIKDTHAFQSLDPKY